MRAFNQIKELVKTSEVLKSINYQEGSDPIFLFTDTSVVGIGA